MTGNTQKITGHATQIAVNCPLRLCVAGCARDACTRSGPAYTNAQVRLKPWGVIPKFGRVTIELPFGFMLRAGSTVATEQMNFGDFNAIYVSSQV